jgi:hypothetical protein
MHQSLQGATFHVEHITPSSVGGADSDENLALACPSCNLGKSNRVVAPDPESGRDAPLFNPRLDHWGDHFEWGSERRIMGRTSTGRATIAALNLNHPRRLLIRAAEEQFDLFPPGA